MAPCIETVAIDRDAKKSDKASLCSDPSTDISPSLCVAEAEAALQVVPICSKTTAPIWIRPALASLSWRGGTVSIVVNPVAGAEDGLSVLGQVTALFAARGITVEPLVARYPGHERSLAREAQGSIVCSLGGRGTLREVVNGLMDRKDSQELTLGVLPNGSEGNLDAKYGIDSALHGAQLVLAGRSRRMDLISCEDLSTHSKTYSSVYVCYGFPVKVVKCMRKTGTFKAAPLTEKMKIAVSGLHTYTTALEVPVGEVLSETRQELAQTVDYSAVCMFVGRLAVHGRDVHEHEAPFDSGKFSLLTRKASDRWKTIRWIKGDVAQQQVTSCIIRPQPDSKKHDCQVGADTVIIDGDVVCGSPCKVGLECAALRVFTA
jgi:diacylglycerol kinase family enzyme